MVPGVEGGHTCSSMTRYAVSMHIHVLWVRQAFNVVSLFMAHVLVYLSMTSAARTQCRNSSKGCIASTVFQRAVAHGSYDHGVAFWRHVSTSCNSLTA